MGDTKAERSRTSTTRHRVRVASADLERSKAARAANEIAQERCSVLAARVAAGDFGDPRVHLHRPSLPTDPTDLRLGKLASVWSSISVGVLLLAFAVLARFSGHLGPGIVVLLVSTGSSKLSSTAMFRYGLPGWS